MLCQVQKQCGKILKGKFATNLKKEFEKCDTAEKARGANSTRTGRKSQAPSSQLQEAIESIINPPCYYNNEFSRHTAITRKLAISLEPPMCPSRYIVKNSVKYFKKWIENIKYLIETEFLEISKIYNHLQETIPSLLSKVVIIKNYVRQKKV